MIWVELSANDTGRKGVKLFSLNIKNTVVPLWQFGFPYLFRCYHVQFLHLFTDKCPKMLGFPLIFVHQTHIVSFTGMKRVLRKSTRVSTEY